MGAGRRADSCWRLRAAADDQTAIRAIRRAETCCETESLIALPSSPHFGPALVAPAFFSEPPGPAARPWSSRSRDRSAVSGPTSPALAPPPLFASPASPALSSHGPGAADAPGLAPQHAGETLGARQCEGRRRRRNCRRTDASAGQLPTAAPLSHPSIHRSLARRPSSSPPWPSPARPCPWSHLSSACSLRPRSWAPLPTPFGPSWAFLPLWQSWPTRRAPDVRGGVGWQCTAATTHCTSSSQMSGSRGTVRPGMRRRLASFPLPAPCTKPQSCWRRTRPLAACWAPRWAASTPPSGSA